MSLASYIDRDTGDGDVIETSPKLSELRRYIEAVAEERRGARSESRLAIGERAPEMPTTSVKSMERTLVCAPSGTTEARRLELVRAWTRLGALFNTAPATTRVDLEQLIVDTAGVARSDERLFVMAASWLAEHHPLIDARRLGRRLDRVDPDTSATAGALLAMATRETTGATALEAALTYCRPLAVPELLFPVMARHPGLLTLVKAETLPLFAVWGFWHNDAVLKRNAIRPIGWVLQHCPELRIRALLGTGSTRK
jgi:hypothetical protein